MTRTPLASSIATLVICSLLPNPGACWAQGSTEAAANRELARRMQREVSGTSEIAAGKAAFIKKDYEAAYAHYKNACESIPAGASAVAVNRKAAVDGFTSAGIKFAEQRVTEGYYASAAQALQEVLKHNPDSQPVLRLLSNIEAPDYFNKQMTPQHRANVEEVKKAFVSAKGYEQLGRLGLAERKYEDRAVRAGELGIPQRMEIRRAIVPPERIRRTLAARPHGAAVTFTRRKRAGGVPMRMLSRTFRVAELLISTVVVATSKESSSSVSRLPALCPS